ncbi:MAG: MBL fold metallo-hydrolase [Gaiellales bacterium]|nr:MBL fold metallo-hydrolase [Gaiellales bacterium]
MRLTWYGHSAFLLEARDGTRIIIDPYRSGAFSNTLRYAPIGDTADAVVASHAHDDHGATDTIPGHPLCAIHPGSLNIGPFTITGLPTFHDTESGRKRGDNTIIVVDVEGLRVAHLGDLGHELDAAGRAHVSMVHVLLIPVGGFYTIDATAAARTVQALQPQVVIPMHYKTDLVDMPIAPVEDFLRTQSRVMRIAGSTLEITLETLPAETTTMVLEHAR